MTGSDSPQGQRATPSSPTTGPMPRSWQRVPTGPTRRTGTPYHPDPAPTPTRHMPTRRGQRLTSGVSAPGLELRVREGGCRDRGPVVTLHDPDPAVLDLRVVLEGPVVVGDLGHPVRSGLNDLVVVASDEVPPHHDLLAERPPA